MDYIVTGLTVVIGLLVIAAALYLKGEKEAKNTFTPIEKTKKKKKKKKKKSAAKKSSSKKSSSKKTSAKKTPSKKASGKKSAPKKKKPAAAAAAAAVDAAPAAAVDAAAPAEGKARKKKVDTIAGTSKEGTSGMFASSYKGEKNDNDGWEQVKTAKPRAEKKSEEKQDNDSTTQKIAVNNMGRLIGKSGENIQRLRDETGAQIEVPDRGSGNKVTVTGTAEAVAAAIALIKEDIGEDQEQQPKFSATIPVNNVGRLIGKGGETIRRLSSGGARIDTPKERKATGNIVTVSGPTQEIVDATIAEIKEVIGDDDATPRVFKSITIKNTQRALIIGRGGETIRKIQEDSGARIDLNKDSGECKVSGAAAGVATAMTAIQAILKKDANTVTEIMKCDRDRFGLVIGRGGETIRALSNEFKVQINTDDANDQIKVRGAEKDVKNAIAKIEDIIAKQKEAGPFSPLADGVESEIVEVADNLKGRIIGTRGATIKKLQADSGAKIDFARKGSDAGCRLSGTAEQIAAAKKLIDEIKEKAKAQEEKAEASRAKAAEDADAGEPSGTDNNDDAEFVGINTDAEGTGW